MTIKYLNDPPTELGTYLLRVDSNLTVAFVLSIGTDSEGAIDIEWLQIGSDYNYWHYSGTEYNIEVIRKLDLEALANESKSKVHE